MGEGVKVRVGELGLAVLDVYRYIEVPSAEWRRAKGEAKTKTVVPKYPGSDPEFPVGRSGARHTLRRTPRWARNGGHISPNSLD